MMRLSLFVFAGCLAVIAGCQWNRPATVDTEAAIDYYANAQMHVSDGDTEQALAELAAALKEDPDLSIVHVTMGDIYRRRGDWDAARVSYENACQTNPFGFRAHYNLGVTYQTLSRSADAVQKARELLRKAIRTYLRANYIDPTDVDTNVNIAGCYFLMGKYDQAEKFGKAAIALRPEAPHAHGNLGLVYDAQGRLHDAVAAYKQSLELDSDQPKILLNLGSSYLRQNRLQPAMEVLKHAAEKAPQDAAPYELLGSCYYKLDRHADAIDAYQKALERNDRSAVAHRGLGVVYMTQFVQDPSQERLRDDALAAWHASLEMDPTQDDLRALILKYTP